MLAAERRMDMAARIAPSTLAVLFTALAAAGLPAQAPVAPTNDAPNPYQTIEGHFRMPQGRTWGSTSAVDVSPDGRFVWVAERCGANSCWDPATGRLSPLDVVLKFDQSGTLVSAFGSGMFVFPHGIHVDRDGNVWVTDGNDNLPRRAADGPPDAPLSAAPARVIGHQVHKFSPEGKLLLTLGRPGGNPADQALDPVSFYQPNDVITLANGDILVAEGHNNTTPSHRVVRFDRGGKYLGSFGLRGSGPGQFIQPHALALDSRGRLFVADRGNNRVQVMTSDGAFIADWRQFSRPSGLFIDRNDMLYSADSESGSVNPPHKAWTRGIRVGSASDGKVMYFIPDPQRELTTGTLAAEGVAVDVHGNVYGAEVGPRKLQKYVMKR
jgi:sugar lactone lactonase YvrE